MPKIHAITFGRLSRQPIGGLGGIVVPEGYEEDGIGVEQGGEYAVLLNDGTIVNTGDVEVGGDVVMGSGSLVDGVDVSNQDALMLNGKSLGTGTSTPVANAMLYFDTEWKAGKSDLLNGGTTSLHYHGSDRNRSNHTGTQLSSTVSDFEHKCFQAELSTDISTNGTTEVDMTWNSNKKNGFTHTDGTASINVDQDGEYLIWVNLSSDFDSDNQQMYVHIYKDVGAGFTKAHSSMANTNRASGCQVTIAAWYESLLSGNDIKITADFGGADAGSSWLADYCQLCILKIDGA